MNTVSRTLWILVVLCGLGLLFGLAEVQAEHDPDLNNDGVVNILDISRVGSCCGRQFWAGRLLNGSAL